MTRDEFDTEFRALIDRYRPSGWARASVVITPFDDNGELDTANVDVLSIRPASQAKPVPTASVVAGPPAIR